MGRRGPHPKPDALRQRTNLRAPARVLPTEEQSATRAVPDLPPRSDGEWHPNVLEWWRSAWRSPMAAAWLEADLRGGLYLLAELWHRRWMTDNTRALLQLSAEIRLLEARFGLSPGDRRRLDWEVETTEDAAPVPEARRHVVGMIDRANDPRAVLRSVP